MKEGFLNLGKIITAGTITVSSHAACTPESEYIKGRVIDIRHEPESIRIEEKIMNISPCPEGTKHLPNACLPEPHEVLLEIRDVPDNILRLERENGEVFDVYVWPRIKRQARIGEPIKINPHYGSLEDTNNTITIISKTRIQSK